MKAQEAYDEIKKEVNKLSQTIGVDEFEFGIEESVYKIHTGTSKFSKLIIWYSLVPNEQKAIHEKICEECLLKFDNSKMGQFLYIKIK